MLESIASTDMSSGVADMDQLHFDFFEALGALASLGDQEFAVGFREFVRYAEHAFAKEETWMEAVNFAADKSHREQHARVLSALHHVYSRVLGGDLVIGRETIETLLPQWFAFHIATMDMTLAAAMQIHDLPQRAPAAIQTAACFQ